MKIGFFGGAFNPPTIAHINLVKEALKEYSFDAISDLLCKTIFDFI